MPKKQASKATTKRAAREAGDAAAKEEANKREPDPVGNAGAPPHAENLVSPPGSLSCAGCGFVYAGQSYCPNCGVNATREQIEAATAARRGGA